MKIERKSRTEEVMLGAYAELAAIAQAFGSKNAIKKLGKALGGSVRSGEGADMSELRRRVGSLVLRGMVTEKT